jgi:hypothetical protein
VRSRSLAGGSPPNLRRRGSGGAQQERHKEEKDKGGDEDSRSRGRLGDIPGLPVQNQICHFTRARLGRIGSCERTRVKPQFTTRSICKHGRDPFLTNCISQGKNQIVNPSVIDKPVQLTQSTSAKNEPSIGNVAKFISQSRIH